MLSDYLPKLRSEFPHYLFSVVLCHHGYSIAAIRGDDSAGPLVVVSADVRELRKLLSDKGKVVML